MGNPYEIEKVRFVSDGPSVIERIESLEAQVAILTDLTCKLQTECQINGHFIEQLLKLDTAESAASA
jgi:hypothetical protein